MARGLLESLASPMSERLFDRLPSSLSVREHLAAPESRRRVRLLTLAAAAMTVGTALPEAAAGSPPGPVTPTCETARAPEAGPRRGFRHRRSSLVARLGDANHRGRDLLLRPDDRQLVIAKMAYGLVDKDLVDENVDIFVLRGCAGTWERLGSARTTDDGDHAAEEGVPDSGGRVYFEIPRAARLAPGRHRVHLSVAGDRSATDLILHVARPGAGFFVADIDGTLTSSGTAEVRALLRGRLPRAHPGAPEALQTLARRGYIPIYLTGRPEPLLGRTRAFLDRAGFPPGLVMTTPGKTGAIGRAAARFKTAQLARTLTARGFSATFAFGDTHTDAAAYASARIRRPFLRGLDTPTGQRFDAYSQLGPLVEGPPVLDASGTPGPRVDIR